MSISDEVVEAVTRALHPGLFEEDSLLHPVLVNSGRWQKRHEVRAALEGAEPLLLAGFVAAVDAVEIGAGSEHFRHGRETMQADAVSAIQDLVHKPQVTP